MTSTHDWTDLAAVKATLLKRYRRGVYLGDYAKNEPLTPIRIPLHGPRAAELAEHFEAARDWVTAWRKVDPALVRLEWKRVGGRGLGRNELPGWGWIDDYEGLWRLIGVSAEIAAFDRMIADTERLAPELVDWLRTRPLRAMKFRAQWPSLLKTVAWIGEHGGSGRYVRELAVPGVDTKFIERHEIVLTELLDVQAANPPDATAQGFTGRFGFQAKPDLVRFRVTRPIAGFTDLTVRLDEFIRPPVGTRTVYVVENEISFLSFPLPDECLLLRGSGFAAAILARLEWLRDLPVRYWGDIDTHGFAILDRLRAGLPAVESMLMDETTLLAHRSQWVTEPTPTSARLDRLTPAEAQLYHDLVANRFGPAVRLEQERVAFEPGGGSS